MAGNVVPFPAYPRSISTKPEPLGLYFRVGHNDHVEYMNLIEAGDTGFNGMIFDATKITRHAQLRDRILELGSDVILDPRTQPAATPGGFNDKISELPWSGERVHTLGDFEGVTGRRRISDLAGFVIENGFTQVLAPTHLLESAYDPWFEIDLLLCKLLRDALDRRGASEIEIIYSLSINLKTLRDDKQRMQIVQSLARMPINAIWIAVEGFGAKSGAVATRTWLRAASDFHTLGVPIVADYAGGIPGKSLLAFGAAGGITHGLTYGERRNTASWKKVKKDKNGFAPTRAVYFPTLGGLMLKPDQAKLLLKSSNRAKAAFGCNDRKCCRRGITDMIENPARHFAVQRIKEIAELGRIPEQLRPQEFMDRHVRSATDVAVNAASINWDNDEMAKKTRKHRKELDALRTALGRHVEEHKPVSFAIVPEKRDKREQQK